MRYIFVAALCAGALLTSCQKTGNPLMERVDPDLAMLVPPDTSILVGAKLDKLRATPTYQKYFSSMSLPRLDDFARETGLDPRKDVSEVLFASDGSQKGVLMLRGKFAPGELEPKLERQGAARTQYKSHNLFGDEKSAVFFMNSSTALAGSTSTLKSIIDNQDSSKLGIPETLQPLVRAVPTTAQFWAVVNGAGVKLPFPEGSNLGNVNQMVRSVQNGYFSADLRTGFDFQAVGTCDTDQAAKQIHDMLKGLVGIGRLTTPENRPEMLKMYDSINVKQEGRVVNVAANVPQDVVDQFVGTFVRQP